MPGGRVRIVLVKDFEDRRQLLAQILARFLRGAKDREDARRRAPLVRERVRQTREVTVYVFHLMKTPSGRQALAHLTKERKLQKKKSDARIGGPRSEFHRFPPISTACIQVRTGVGFRAELNAER